jgi:CRISPR-associated endonuclease/helicase Cas3
MNALDGVWAKSRARPGDPRGELLTEHLLAAREAALSLRERTGAIPGMPEQFWNWVCLACLLHDAGKIPDGFQQMVGNPGPARPWGQRHEVYSLGFAASVLDGLPAGELGWVMLGIAAHHRPFEGEGKPPLKGYLNAAYRTPEKLSAALGRVDPDAVRELHAWLLHESGRPAAIPPSPDWLACAAHHWLSELIGTWTGDPDSRECLTGVLVQGAVTLADRASSANSPFLLRQPLDGAYPQALTSRLAAKGKPLHPHQEKVLAVDGHVLLRAPTGSGKTEAALLWASRQVELIRRLRAGHPRVFYTLPYLASINAMSGRLREEAGAGSVGVAHSRAASYYLKLAIDGCDHDPAAGENDLAARAARQAVARNRATRLFREPVRVGTPYQLVRGALAGPAHSGILIDSANSVFILDELHAYEPRRLGMILAMLGLWSRLGGRIAVISATLPQAMADLVTTALGEQPALVEPGPSWNWPIRHRLELRTGHLTADTSISEIRQRLASGASVLVVANNVADAIGLSRTLAPEVTARHGPDSALLLHSRFKAGDRADIEKKILARFEAGRPRQPGLLVATQTVEVSLNVDFDVLHTSGAPLEPLIQRFGRVNRLGALPGPALVVVHPPAFGSRGRSGPEFADGIYDAVPTRLAGQILARNDGGTLDEKLFGHWLDEVYASDWGREWRASVMDEYRNWDEQWLWFEQPFRNRDYLANDFDRLFDGTEAILQEDRSTYRKRLSTGNTSAEGRLLAADLLLPVPAYAGALGRFDRDLGVTVIDGEYDPATGLTAIRGPQAAGYVPGEVL